MMSKTLSANKPEMYSKSSTGTAEILRKPTCTTYLKCEKLIDESPYLQILKYYYDIIEPISTKKSIKQSEALTKIWMSPSSELLQGVVPDPNEDSNEAAGKQKDKKKRADAEISERVIAYAARKRSYSSNLSSFSVHDLEFDGYASGEFPSNIDFPFDDIFIDVESEFSEEELPFGKTHETQEERIHRLLSVEMRQYKETVKQLYIDELEKMTTTIQENALIDLDERMAKMFIGIKEQMKEKVKDDLKEINRFIRKYKKDVMIEYFEKINLRYKNRRNDAIVNVIAKIDDELGFSCNLVTQLVRNNYMFKLKYLQATAHEEFLRKLKEAKVKWTKIVQDTKQELLEVKSVGLAKLEDEFLEKFQAFLSEEDQLIQEKISAIDEEVERDLESKISVRLGQQKERVDSLLSDAVRNTWEEETWKCIVKKLLHQIQNFIDAFIDPSGQTNFVKVYNEMKATLKEVVEPKRQTSVVSSILSDTSDLEEMIYCGPPNKVRTTAERKAHRELINIATSLINHLADTAVHISRARQAEAKARRLARKLEYAQQRAQEEVEDDTTKSTSHDDATFHSDTPQEYISPRSDSSARKESRGFSASPSMQANSNMVFESRVSIKGETSVWSHQKVAIN